MLLKSLELQGYKTFANRTLFEFAGSVTAIVGPNGSGKSNIADSVRWVLGEQSYSLLRGKKTADMIFSGSEKRSRAGMASATILFDNSAGWLPIDFSEVAITRRAYRDGQNEYLINNQRVRLRDVSELLAQSGLAERTYTIIGQGVVDAALALKAEERRRLFEEAAGIGLHRSRRTEALRRLETTQRNLERVQDIMAELRPRLRSLERQARRAQEYDQVRSDLLLALREWYGYYWHHAQHELAEAFDFAQIQESALEKVRNEQLTLDRKMKVSRQKIQSLRAQLGAWHMQLAQFHTQREETSRQQAVSDERKRSYDEQVQEIHTDIARLQEEVGLQRERLQSISMNVERGEKELADAILHSEKAHKELQLHQTGLAEAELSVETSRRSMASLQSRQGELKARLSERINLNERLEVDCDQMGLANQQAKEALEVAQEKKEAAGQARHKAEENLKQIEDALVIQSQHLNEVENSRRDTNNEYSELIAKKARIQAELDVLESAEQSLVGYGSGAQLLIKAARENRLKGTHGALSNLLEVNKELDVAIASALGEYLDAIVLDDSVDPGSALDLLIAENSRGALLPLNKLAPSTTLKLGSKDGVLGVAAKLVSTTPEFLPVVEFLLGKTLIVQDRSTAYKLLSEINSDLGDMAGSGLDGLRVVTLNGEVFYGSGPILAGREGRITTLNRPRRRKELASELKNIDEHVTRLVGELAELDQEIDVLGEKVVALQDDLKSAQQAAKGTISIDNQARAAAEQAEREVRWQEDGQKRLQKEIDHGVVEIASIRKELSGLEVKISQAQEELREKIEDLNAISVEEYQTQAAHWDTLKAVAEQRLDNARLRHEENELVLKRVETELEQSHTRLIELKASVETLEDQKKDLRSEESGINEQIQNLRLLIDPAESELEGLEKAQEELLLIETNARQSLSSAEHKFAQARIGLGRAQETLDSWRRRIEDDFGLVDFNYADEVSGPTPLPLDGLVEHLPRIDKLSPEIEENVKRQRLQLRRIGAINPEAQNEYQEVKQRVDFLTDQVADLEKAEADIRHVIAELDVVMEQEFCKTFDEVAEEFGAIFRRVFGGGSAHLTLTDPDDLTNTGIDIEAKLPGRRAQGLSLLSGGERSLTATSLIFALLKFSPTPFCLLDEVDAMLDESNVGRFRDLLRELSQNTQFIIVTHNRNTVQVADVIYGVTMGRDSASQVISLKMDEVSQVVK